MYGKLEVVVPVNVKRWSVDWIVIELWMTKPDVEVRLKGLFEQDDDDGMNASSVWEDCEK